MGGASALVTRVEAMGNDHLAETAIWTAFNPGPVQVFTESDTVFAFGEPIFFDDFE